jgi:REP element-mobilizing transposase RayT
MNRGAARQATFVTDHDYHSFLHTVAEARQRWGIEVFAYCLMPNHYHVCLRTPQGNLSRVMRHIDGLYTQRFNRSHQRDGALFRGRYKAIVVDAEEYLSAVVRYIHLNPLAVALASMPEAYRWSSHQYYLHPKGRPDWLHTREVAEPLGGKNAFHEYVLSGNEEALTRFYQSSRQSPVLGGEQFVERIRGTGAKLGREHPRYARRGLQPGAEQVIEAVARWFSVAKEEILRGVRGKENGARKVAMYLVTRCCDTTLQETASLFGLKSYGAVGWCCHGIQAKMATDKRFKNQLEKIREHIGRQ